MSGNEAGALFAPFVFYISREAPKAPLEFILHSFGCKRIGWDAVLGGGAFTHDETDPRITHQIVDRPQLPQGVPSPLFPLRMVLSRRLSRVPASRVVHTFQPQWVWDCINDGKLLRADLYAPGATLPPHLSPWVKPSRGGYDPRATLAEQEEEGEAEMAEDDAEDSDEEMEDEAPVDEKAAVEEESEDESVDGGMDVAGTDDDESASDEEEEDEDFGGFEENEAATESDDDDEAAQTQHQRELEAEAAGLPFTASSATDESSKKKTAQSKKLAAKRRRRRTRNSSARR